ncbi:MAG: DUF1385 domain-containing protein [Clostridia bacterium]|nr:DUF1385 domain-containing protein [Clostridia bacterium]
MRKKELSCRSNKVGGQALIEGVMMKNGTKVAIAVRKGDGTIEIENTEFHPAKEKHKWINIPILRGIVGFVESLMLSFKTLGKATDMLGLEDEDEKAKQAKKEKKKAKKEKANEAESLTNQAKSEVAEAIKEAEGESAEKVAQGVNSEGKKEEKKSSGSTVAIMAISLVIGLALAIALFTILPTRLSELIVGNFNLDPTTWQYFIVVASFEGAMKVIIFIGYLLAVSLMKDIRRTFQYHGAEHKSIACFESGMELTPENAKKCTRFHPRCGTSFMFVMILLSIVIGIFIPLSGWLRVVVRLAILPLVMGLGYEFIMFAGKHQNIITRALSAPGLWMQRITTKEPDEYQLAIAICAIKASMKDEFPDFTPDEYFITPEENKGHIAYEKPKEEK